MQMIQKISFTNAYICISYKITKCKSFHQHDFPNLLQRYNFYYSITPPPLIIFSLYYYLLTLQKLHKYHEPDEANLPNQS